VGALDCGLKEKFRMRSSALARLLWVVNGVLAVALVAACYGSYRLLAREGSSEAAADVREEDGKTARLLGDRTLADYAVIWQLDSFLGNSLEKEVRDAANTQGEIRCLGTTVARSESGGEVGQYSYALLEDSTGERRMVRQGDGFGGWILVRVEKDGVLLRRGGEERSLSVEKRDGEEDFGESEVKTTRVRLPVGKQPTVDFSAYVKPTSDVTREVKRGLYGLIMGGGRLYEEVAQSALLVPHTSDGEPDGVEVERIQEGSLAGHLGFRNGDLIVGVSGETISSLEEALRLIPLIMKQSRVEVTLRRGGKMMTYYFDLR
jgi:type II secretory pathway component PulC